ncbi:MAG: hypothetical protein Q4G66_08825 [bacterium]|nr:hypothetical protein [bacterium]
MDHTTQPGHGQYIYLRADNLRLLVPQEDMGEVEHLNIQPVASGTPGLLASPDDSESCFIALSDSMRLMDYCPDGRYVTTKLPPVEGMEIRCCWTEVHILIDYQPHWQDVPEILLLADSPLRHFAIMNDQPVFLCAGQALQNIVFRAGI